MRWFGSRKEPCTNQDKDSGRRYHVRADKWTNQRIDQDGVYQREYAKKEDEVAPCGRRLNQMKAGLTTANETVKADPSAFIAPMSFRSIPALTSVGMIYG